MPLIHSIARGSSKAELWRLPQNTDDLIQEASAQGIELPDEIAGYKNISRIGQYLLARMITHNHFGHHNIRYHENGKPFLDEGYLSMSHTRHFFAWYFSPQNEVGIDIEEHSPRVMRIRHKFLNEDEKAFCTGDVLKNLVVWCSKESIFKKFGDQTTYFRENIHVLPFHPVNNFEISARVTTQNNVVEQNLYCELIHDLVMVYTV